MREEKLQRLMAGIDPWSDNFGNGMERRGTDGMSWYDLSINCNSAPCRTDLVIIVTAWFGQLKWLRAVLEQYRLSGAFVILAYDNPFYPWVKERSAEVMARQMPNMVHYLLAHAVVHKHITYDADKRNGWFWDVRYAQGIIKQFSNIKHVYVTNGDCICERPQGFKEIIELLGDADLMAGQSYDATIHTADMLFKVDAFHALFDRMFKEFEFPVIGSRSPEGTLKECVEELALKVKHAPKQPLDVDGTVDCYARHGQDSTWKKVLGFRNLFAEQETKWNLGGEPLPRRYVDDFMDWCYFAGDERETICKYWETGDRRYLYKWWDCGEDSWYNRIYYDVGHYGKEPIYA